MHRLAKSIALISAAVAAEPGNTVECPFGTGVAGKLGGTAVAAAAAAATASNTAAASTQPIAPASTSRSRQVNRDQATQNLSQNA